MEYKFTKLKNGAKLLFVPDANSEVCTLMVYFGVGSRHEAAKVNGISHFIEHLLFKGSAKRPHYLDLSIALDSLGAEYNAFTAKDVTAYYIKFDKNKIEEAVDILADMVRFPVFDEKEINQERGVIIQEIKMYEDNPSWYIDDLLEQSVFAGHGLGPLIIGPQENIKTISAKTIRDYYNKHYTPANLLVAVAGGFDQTKMTSLLEASLGDKSWKKGPTAEMKKFVNKQKAARDFVLKRETKQVQLAFGWPSVAMGEKEVFTQAVLATLLGGTMSSRLFVEIREKRGLAYSVRAGVEQYADAGAFVVKLGLDADKIDAAVKVLKTELTKISSDLAGEEEIRRAKDSLLGHYTLRLESPSSRMQYIAKQIILGQKIIQPKDFRAQVEKVTAKDLTVFAKKVFASKKLNVSMIGPYKDGKKIIKALTK
jgi:predicted Zn-dependent peptidase